MTTLREAAQQALEALEYYQHRKLEWDYSDEVTITALRAALAQEQVEPVQEPPKRKLVPTEPTIGMCIAGDEARQNVDDLTRTPAIYRAMIAAAPASPQQAEPVQEPVAGRAFLERILAAMEGVLDVADRKTDEFDALRSCVIDLTVMLHAAPPQQVAQQAEPLNLSDPAVQKRLATQWGYVPAAQAEPVEPVAWYQKRGQEVFTWPHPACWGQEDKPWTPLYTAPPQRKPLPKHDQHCVDVPGYGLMAVRLVRAIERAHGIT